MHRLRSVAEHPTLRDIGVVIPIRVTPMIMDLIVR
jgi:hypothetical protein